MTNARELASRLLDLLRREQSAMADFLVALAAFDESRAWAELGHTSLFYFLHKELGMSKGAAHYRKTAAELIRRVPELVEPLRDGRICITSIIELAKVLTPENRHEVLPRFFNCSRQEAKAVSAELCPAEAAPHRTVVTAMPVAMPARAKAIPVPADVVQPVEPPPITRASPCLLAPAVGAPAPLETFTSPALALGQKPLRLDETPPAQASAAAVLASVAPPALPVPPVPPVPPRTAVEPLTADLRRLHVTVSRRFMEKLDAARDALSHSHPAGDAEGILEAGLDLLIERAAKRRGCTSPRAEKNSRPTGSSQTAPSPGLSPGAGERGDALRFPTEVVERGDPPDGERAASRHIPAHVKREVWLRDGGRCQFKLENGGAAGLRRRAHGPLRAGSDSRGAVRDEITSKPRLGRGGAVAPTRTRLPLASSPVVAASDADAVPACGEVTTGEAARQLCGTERPVRWGRGESFGLSTGSGPA